jgi:hypothetical protein
MDLLTDIIDITVFFLFSYEVFASIEFFGDHRLYLIKRIGRVRDAILN